MQMRKYQDEFCRKWLKNVYMLMSPRFRKTVKYSDILDGLHYGLELGIQDTLDFARYTYTQSNVLYGNALGLLAADLIDRYDPVNMVKEVEGIADDIQEFYWEQLSDLCCAIPYGKKGNDKYALNEVDEFIYAQELLLMNMGKHMALLYENSNGVPTNMNSTIMSYNFIGNMISYLWILSQLEPLSTLGENVLNNETIKGIINGSKCDRKTQAAS